MTETIKMRGASGIVHLANPSTHTHSVYDTLCGLWANFAWRVQPYDKVSNDTEVTCKKCLKKIAKGIKK